MEALGGLSFSQALYESLQNAKRITADDPPRLVLLTGGASRMPFFQEQCRDAFADAVVVICSEPEFSIAKGLAYAGWVDENLRAFRKAIREEVTDERVGLVARNALPELIPSVVNALVELTLTEAAIPVVASWKHGDIDTLAHMNEQMQRRVERVLASSMAEQALSPHSCQMDEGTGRYPASHDRPHLRPLQCAEGGNAPEFYPERRTRPMCTSTPVG